MTKSIIGIRHKSLIPFRSQVFIKSINSPNMNMRQATTLTAIPMYLMILEDLHSVAWGMRNLSESSDTTATEPSSEHSQLVLLASVGVISIACSNLITKMTITFCIHVIPVETVVQALGSQAPFVPRRSFHQAHCRTWGEKPFTNTQSKLQTQNAYHEYDITGHNANWKKASSLKESRRIREV